MRSSTYFIVTVVTVSLSSVNPFDSGDGLHSGNSITSYQVAQSNNSVTSSTDSATIESANKQFHYMLNSIVYSADSRASHHFFDLVNGLQAIEENHKNFLELLSSSEVEQLLQCADSEVDDSGSSYPVAETTDAPSVEDDDYKYEEIIYHSTQSRPVLDHALLITCLGLVFALVFKLRFHPKPNINAAASEMDHHPRRPNFTPGTRQWMFYDANRLAIKVETNTEKRYKAEDSSKFEVCEPFPDFESAFRFELPNEMDSRFKHIRYYEKEIQRLKDKAEGVFIMDMDMDFDPEEEDYEMIYQAFRILAGYEVIGSATNRKARFDCNRMPRELFECDSESEKEGEEGESDGESYSDSESEYIYDQEEEEQEVELDEEKESLRYYEMTAEPLNVYATLQHISVPHTAAPVPHVAPILHAALDDSSTESSN